MMNAESLVACLELLELAFVRASQVALKLEKGDPAVDIVTEAFGMPRAILRTFQSSMIPNRPLYIGQGIRKHVFRERY